MKIVSAQILTSEANAQELFLLSDQKRIHVMKALATLSRYLGCYNKWRDIKDRDSKCISDVEYWTTEYIVDRLFFEMTESSDDAQGWEDYEHKGQRKK